MATLTTYIALFLLGLRAVIAPGVMVVPAANGGGALAIVICSGGGLASLAVDGKYLPDGGSHGVDLSIGAGDCAFGALHASPATTGESERVGFLSRSAVRQRWQRPVASAVQARRTGIWRLPRGPPAASA